MLRYILLAIHLASIFIFFFISLIVLLSIVLTIPTDNITIAQVLLGLGSGYLGIYSLQLYYV